MTEVDIKKLDYTVEEENDFKFERIHIRGRTDDGGAVHIYNDEVDSYFYVPTEQVDHSLRNNDMVLELEDGIDSIRGQDMTRIYTYIPGHVPKVREGYDHYEADIMFPNRFSLDTDVYGAIEIPDEHANSEPSEVMLDEIERVDFSAPSRITFCDIEVDDSNGFPDETEGEEQILSISVYDTFEQEYRIYLYDPDEREYNPSTDHIDDIEVISFTDEVEMLEEFADWLTTSWPDVIAGWNFKEFDAMYLISRFDYLSDLDSSMLSPLGTAYNDGWYGGKIRGISVFDQLEGYKNLQFTELDSFSLRNVAEEELDVGKLNPEDEKVSYMWENNIDELIEYNIRDVYLTVELEKSQDIIQFYEEVANFVGGRLSEVVDYSKAADIYVLRVVNDMFAVPSMDTISGGDDDDFEGAAVFDPATEIKEMVSVLDLKSLYPMSMKTLNAGPRTKDPNGEITAPNGVSFTTDKKSVISDIIDNLLEEREEKKEIRDSHGAGSSEYVKYDLQQRAIKVIMNTLYGILGWERFRLYDKDVAAAVTATGRECIKFTENEVNEMGYEVIYGDTDSVMVEFDEAETIDRVIHQSYQMAEYINERYDDFAEEVLNTDVHYLEIEFEKVYKVFMQAGKKKRYAGHIVFKEGKHVDSVDIVGLETQRSDYSAAAKELMETLIDEILKGASKAEVSDLVRGAIEDMKDLEYSLDELGIPGGIGQAFDKYDTKTKQVRGAEYANEYFGEEIQPGDKPKGIYVDKIAWEDDSKPQPPQMSDSAYICWMNSNNVPERTQIDWEKYLDIQINSPLSRVIECTEWMWSEIVTGQDQAGIDSFGTDSGSDEMAGFGDDLEVETTETSDEPSVDEFEVNSDASLDSFDNSSSATLDDFDEDEEEEESINTLSQEEVLEMKRKDKEEKQQRGLDDF